MPQIVRNLVFCPSFLLGVTLGNWHSSASYEDEATSCSKVSRISVDGRQRKYVYRWKRKKHA